MPIGISSSYHQDRSSAPSSYSGADAANKQPVVVFKSQSIPINNKGGGGGGGGVHRTASELQLCQDEALADYRDFVVFQRIVTHMQQRQQQERRQQKQKLKQQYLQQENEKCLQHILSTRQQQYQQPPPDIPTTTIKTTTTTTTTMKPTKNSTNCCDSFQGGQPPLPSLQSLTHQIVLTSEFYHDSQDIVADEDYYDSDDDGYFCGEDPPTTTFQSHHQLNHSCWNVSSTFTTAPNMILNDDDGDKEHGDEAEEGIFVMEL